MKRAGPQSLSARCADQFGGGSATAGFGALVISLDLELHWGVRDLAALDQAERSRLLAARRAIPRLLDLFEQYEVAATWATVGMLFAHTRAELARYSPTPRPAYDEAALGPYDEPVGEGEHDDPFHYGHSLITQIRARPRQEIGSHTFSHYYCLEPGQDEAAFRADLGSAAAIAAAQGLTLRSLVLPRNQHNPRYGQAVAEAGFTAYRGCERHWMYRPGPLASKQHPLKRIARLLDGYLPLSGEHLSDWHGLRQPDGLCNIQSSRFLRALTPALRPLGRLHVRRIAGGIRAAARSRSIFHLWWHPEDFAELTEANLAMLRAVLDVYAACRRESGMRSLTMAEVAAIARGETHAERLEAA